MKWVRNCCQSFCYIYIIKFYSQRISFLIVKVKLPYGVLENLMIIAILLCIVIHLDQAVAKLEHSIFSVTVIRK